MMISKKRLKRAEVDGLYGYDETFDAWSFDIEVNTQHEGEEDGCSYLGLIHKDVPEDLVLALASIWALAPDKYDEILTLLNLPKYEEKREE